MNFSEIFLALVIFCSYANSGYSSPVENLQENFPKNNAEFSYDIYSQISKAAPGKNVIVGPYSISSALILAYLGANPDVAEEFVPVLRLQSNDKSVVSSTYKTTADFYENDKHLKVANKVYIGASFEVLPNYKKTIEESFHAEIENVDFGNANEAAKIINNWIDEKTNHKIKELVSPDNINSDLNVFIANAVHFKAEWEHPFQKSLTEKEKFFYQPDQHVDVEMMSRGNIYVQSPQFNFGKSEELQATIIELPYKDSEFSMMVILPNSDRTIADVEGKLKDKNLFEISKGLKSEYVDIRMPKFKIEFGIELSDILKEMGIKKAFNGGINEIVSMPSEISKVLHKAFIEVDETKTEAAGVGGVLAFTRSGPMPLPNYETFKADRPFIYIIKDSKTVQFMGKYCASEKL